MEPAVAEKKKYTYEDYLKTPDDERLRAHRRRIAYDAITNTTASEDFKKN